MNWMGGEDSNAAVWWTFPPGKVHVMVGPDTAEFTPDEAREYADECEEHLKERGTLDQDAMSFLSDIKEFADEIENL